MSVFPVMGSSRGWNYNDENKKDFSTSIVGTVVEIDNPVSRNYQTKQIERWDDGNVKRNMRFHIKVQDTGEEKTWTFVPSKNSLASKAVLSALGFGPGNPNVAWDDILGKLIQVSTTNGVYNQANPRPWKVQIIGDGDAGSVRGCTDLTGKDDLPQPMPTMQQQQQVRQAFRQPMQRPMQQQYQQPVQQYQQPMQQPMQQQYQQPMQQPAQQYQQQPMQQPPVEQVPYYDEDIPF